MGLSGESPCRESSRTVDSILVAGICHRSTGEWQVFRFGIIVLLMFIIKDEYGHAVNQFIHLMAIIHEMNRDLHIEVFAHKAESLSEDYRLGIFLRGSQFPL